MNNDSRANQVVAFGIDEAGRKEVKVIGYAIRDDGVAWC